MKAQKAIQELEKAKKELTQLQERRGENKVCYWYYFN